MLPCPVQESHRVRPCTSREPHCVDFDPESLFMLMEQVVRRVNPRLLVARVDPLSAIRTEACGLSRRQTGTTKAMVFGRPIP